MGEGKHQWLAIYIDIARAARRKFIGPGRAGATFIDLYSGPGRSFVRGTDEFIDGSPLVAWKAAAGSATPFSEIHVNDQEESCVNAAVSRLRQRGATVCGWNGTAERAAESLATALNAAALHLAFVDPFKLHLPFEVFRSLSVQQLEGLGFEGETRFELITGSKNQPLYWLVLIAKHDLAARFWTKALQVRKAQRGLFNED